MLGTAYYRHGPTISYEVFYRVHYLFLVVYSLTIAHTVDASQRSGEKSRTQTFTWFIAPILYYFCDYTMMWFNQKFRVSVDILSCAWSITKSCHLSAHILCLILY